MGKCWLTGSVLSVATLLCGCGVEYGDPLRSPIATPDFDGQYRLIAEESFRYSRDELAAETDPHRQRLLREILEFNEAYYSNFRIDHGVITSGGALKQAFSLQTAKIDGGELAGEAIWHEDVHDPGDMSRQSILLRLDGDRLTFRLGSAQTGFDLNLDTVVLRRVEP